MDYKYILKRGRRALGITKEMTGHLKNIGKQKSSAGKSRKQCTTPTPAPRVGRRGNEATTR
jgi:hypothetical protein